MNATTHRPGARWPATAGRWPATAPSTSCGACEPASARITLNRPERKNPLTFESYAELRDLFRALRYADDVQAVVLAGAGGNFCSGGDVHEIIGPLIKLKAPELLMFTRMTGDLVKAMRALPAADRRRDRRRVRRRRRDHRDGLRPAPAAPRAARPRSCSTASAWPAATWAPARCCRASSARAARSELLYTGRALGGEEGERWGFFNRLCAPEALLAEAQALAQRAGRRPDLRQRHHQDHAAPGMGMTIDQAIEAEAQAQAICMLTEDFGRAYQRLRRQAEAGVRGQLSDGAMSRHALPRLAVLRAAPPRAARASSTPGPRRTSPHDARRRRRRRSAARWCARSAHGGWLRHAVAGTAYGGAAEAIDTRAICLIRETLARHSGLADFAFAMQGLGSGAITPGRQRRRRRRATCRGWRAARRSPPSRCPSPRPAPTSAAMRCDARVDGDALRARRREDLDLQRRHRRLLRGLRAHRRGARRARHLRLHRRRRHARASRSPSAST